MYAIEGYSHKEIADNLGIEEASSRSQYAKAKKYLQQQIINLEKINL
jgi:RNA polymerase sigma-70 factor (ECF subfamily)